MPGKMPGKVTSVAVCDATNVEGITTAGYIAAGWLTASLLFLYP